MMALSSLETLMYFSAKSKDWIVSVIIFVIDGQKSLMLEKNKFAKLLFVYTFEPVDGVFCIFQLI